KAAREDLRLKHHASAWAKFDEIIEALTDIEPIADIDLRPYFSQAMLGAAQSVSRMNPAKIPNKFEIALDYLNRALEADPENLFLNGEKAWQLYYAGRYQDSIQQADKILIFSPKNSSALNVRVISMMRLAESKADITRVDSAIEWMRQVLKETQDAATRNRLESQIERITAEWSEIKKLLNAGARLATPEIPEILNDGVSNLQRKKDYFSLDEDVLVNTRFLDKPVQERLNNEGSFVRDTHYVRARITDVFGLFITVTYYAADGTALLDLSTEEAINRDAVWKQVSGSRLLESDVPPQFGPAPTRKVGGQIYLKEIDEIKEGENLIEFLDDAATYQNIESVLHNFWTHGFQVGPISFRIDTHLRGDFADGEGGVAVGEVDHTLLVYNPNDPNAIPAGINK
ncbi:MAG: hypothetical protein KDA77_22385, partial [Planctomycetaceae bacterium]|nr:hypothetical protein [Planctomycetaceae bacterium]